MPVAFGRLLRARLQATPHCPVPPSSISSNNNSHNNNIWASRMQSTNATFVAHKYSLEYILDCVAAVLAVADVGVAGVSVAPVAAVVASARPVARFHFQFLG